MASAVVAIAAAVITGVLAFKGSSPIWALLGSVVTAVALFIAFPTLLSPSTVNISEAGNWIACVIGLAIVVLAMTSQKIHTSLVLLGVILLFWGLFRNIPSLPPAFKHLGLNLHVVWIELVKAVTDFYNDVTASPATSRR